MERLQEYRTHNSQFCKRLFDFLSIMFVAQVSCSKSAMNINFWLWFSYDKSKILLGGTSGVANSRDSRPIAIPHTDLESYLGRYAGLMLYIREMDENIYSKICAVFRIYHSRMFSHKLSLVLLLCRKQSSQYSNEDIIDSIS
jgi:hypothetical protein